MPWTGGAEEQDVPEAPILPVLLVESVGGWSRFQVALRADISLNLPISIEEVTHSYPAIASDEIRR